MMFGWKSAKNSITPHCVVFRYNEHKLPGKLIAIFYYGDDLDVEKLADKFVEKLNKRKAAN